MFLPQNYVPCLAGCIMECLQRARDSLSGSKDCSLEFVSRLIGKLCFTGSAGLFLTLFESVLFDFVCAHVHVPTSALCVCVCVCVCVIVCVCVCVCVCV